MNLYLCCNRRYLLPRCPACSIYFVVLKSYLCAKWSRAPMSTLVIRGQTSLGSSIPSTAHNDRKERIPSLQAFGGYLRHSHHIEDVGTWNVQPSLVQERGHTAAHIVRLHNGTNSQASVCKNIVLCTPKSNPQFGTCAEDNHILR